MSRAPIFIGSEIYRGSSYGGQHPLRVPRVSTVMDLLRALDWLGPGQYRSSPQAKPGALTRFHSPDYIAALQAAEAAQQVSDAVRARHQLGTLANPIFPEMFRRPATSVGGAMLAGALLARGGAVFCPGAGTHHGMRDRANGFCYLNDLVFAVAALRRHGAQRVAYVDIDAHHPDGVVAAFAHDPDMLMISVHEERRWPWSGALGERGIGNQINLPVPAGLNDSEFALIREALVLPAVAEFAPDAVILQCGADALQEDPLSRLGLSNNAHVAMLAGLAPLAPRLLVTGGGGYNPWSVARCWARIWAQLAGHALPAPLPPRAQSVLRDLRRGPWVSRARPPQEAWMVGLADPPREGPLREELRARLAQLAPVVA